MTTKTKRFTMWYSIPAGSSEKSMFLDVETLEEAWDVGRQTVAGLSVADGVAVGRPTSVGSSGRVNRIEAPEEDLSTKDCEHNVYCGDIGFEDPASYCGPCKARYNKTKK